MLQTLIQIGKETSAGMSKWDDIIDIPNLDKEKDKNQRLYIANMLFNLDEGEIKIDPDSLKEYDEQAPADYMNVKIQGGNNKAIYVTVFAPKSLEQFRKTFFGIVDKKGSKPVSGQFTEAIDKYFPEFSETLFANCLKEIFKLRSIFERQFIGKRSNAFVLRQPQKKSDDDVYLYEKIGLDKQDVLVLLSSSVIATELGITEPTLLSKIAGYKEFLEKKFIGNSQEKTSNEKLCYASGEIQPDVTDISFNTRYNINKMFVTTTRNYAPDFQADGFGNNYQASGEIQKFLERGSERILRNHTILIAGISHCIIPRLFSQTEAKMSDMLVKLTKRSELLFQTKQLKDLKENVEDSETAIYWVDFLGYESDGNYFKTINYIKDVSQSHFNNLLKTFQDINWRFRDIEGIAWDKVMSRGKDQVAFIFNFQSFYSIIPLRKDKEKKNEALVLFKAILEQRAVNAKKLFQLYRELVLCHKFHRYKSYTNIYAPETISERTMHFDFAVRNATYQYLAVFNVLKQLKLLSSMEQSNESDVMVSQQRNKVETFQEKVEAFFQEMGYSENQKAMYYLGRALSSIASAQVKAKHPSKPILEKVNYNGMDVRSILKLYRELREKVKQYVKHNTIQFTEPHLSEFDKRFQPSDWNMNSDEALFFLFSGYSFYIKKEKTTEDEIN